VSQNSSQYNQPITNKIVSYPVNQPNKYNSFQHNSRFSRYNTRPFKPLTPPPIRTKFHNKPDTIPLQNHKYDTMNPIQNKTPEVQIPSSTTFKINTNKMYPEKLNTTCVDSVTKPNCAHQVSQWITQNRFEVFSEDDDNTSTSPEIGSDTSSEKSVPLRLPRNQYGREIFQKLNIHGYPYPVKALVDTGATCSTISPTFLQELKNSNAVMKIKQVESVTFHTATIVQTPQVANEAVLLAFEMKNMELVEPFVILPCASTSITLGLDIMGNYDMAVHTKSLELKLNEKVSVPTNNIGVPTVKREETKRPKIKTPQKVHRVYTKSAYEIPARSFQRISVFSKDCITGSILLTPQRLVEEMFPVHIGNSIINLESGKGETYIMNLTPETVTLPRLLQIGEYEDCEVPEDYDCDNNDNLNVKVNSIKVKKSKLTDEQWNTFDISPNLTDVQKGELRNIVEQNRQAFAFSDAEIGLAKGHYCVVDTGDSPPIYQRPYRQSPTARQITQDILNEDLKNGLIQPSKSPYGSPVVLVKKKDGSHRLCIDFRKLNKSVKKNTYPIPLIDDVVDHLHGTAFMSTVDANQGFKQMEVHPDSIEKTAFVTPDGKYECLRMPFGLCVSPAEYQMMMDKVLGSLKWSICMVYIDDIVIHGKSWQEHLERLNTVLRTLSNAGITLKPKKCRLGFTELPYLGYIISSEGISVDPEKISAITQYPRPENPEDIRKFLGMCGYYRRFVKNFSAISSPLTQLLHKDCDFKWIQDQESAFVELKTKLTEAPVLAYPSVNGEIEITCDASGFGIGAICTTSENGEPPRPIAFASRTLSPAEKKYSTTERECLAVVFAVEKFRPYVYGKRFKVRTDHNSLQYLLNLKDPHSRLARWSLKLQVYDFDVVYTPGKSLPHADALSRHPVINLRQLSVPFEDLSEEELSADEPVFSQCSEATRKAFMEAQLSDRKVLKIIEIVRKSGKIKTVGPPHIIAENYALLFGLLYKSQENCPGRLWKLVVPKSMRKKVFESVHGHISGAHFGVYKTWQAMKLRYTWPKMFRDIEKFLKMCTTCQAFNPRTTGPPGPMKCITPPSIAFSKVAIDYIGPFPRTPSGNTCALTIIDHTTRYLICVPCKAQTSAAAIQAVMYKLIYQHGTPNQLIADSGAHFRSEEFENFCEERQIKLIHPVPYRPQGNGINERNNGTVKRAIAKYINKNHNNWDVLIPKVTFAINTHVSEATSYSPFYLVHGREANLPSDFSFPVLFSDLIESPEDREIKIQEAINHANERTVKQQQQRADKFNKLHKPHQYTVNQKVWVATHGSKKGLLQKWLPHWKGPCVIVYQLSSVSFLVRDLNYVPKPGLATEFIRVHIAQIKEYTEDSDSSNIILSEEELEDLQDLLEQVREPDIVTPQNPTTITNNRPLNQEPEDEFFYQCPIPKTYVKSVSQQSNKSKSNIINLTNNNISESENESEPDDSSSHSSNSSRHSENYNKSRSNKSHCSRQYSSDIAEHTMLRNRASTHFNSSRRSNKSSRTNQSLTNVFIIPSVSTRPRRTERTFYNNSVANSVISSLTRKTRSGRISVPPVRLITIK
jgi:transposase InsO family protein